MHIAAQQILEGRRAVGLAQVRHGGQLQPGVEHRERRLETAVVHRGHDRARARTQPVQRNKPADPAGQHHARQVVAGEEQRLLDRPGCEHEPPRADLMQDLALPDGHEAVVHAECGRIRQKLHARLSCRGRQLAGALVATLEQEPPAGLGSLVGEHDVSARLGRGNGRRQARRAAAHHQHVGVAAAVLGTPLALLRGDAREAPETRGVAQHLLVEGPEAPRLDEGLVVEAGRGQPRAHAVGHGHEVEVETGRGVHVFHAHALARRLRACANSRSAVDGH